MSKLREASELSTKKVERVTTRECKLDCKCTRGLFNADRHRFIIHGRAAATSPTKLNPAPGSTRSTISPTNLTDTCVKFRDEILPKTLSERAMLLPSDHIINLVRGSVSVPIKGDLYERRGVGEGRAGRGRLPRAP